MFQALSVGSELDTKYTYLKQFPIWYVSIIIHVIDSECKA